ncbi:MAG: hypothetical protein QM755_19090 [Luteolibacter sp.]
MIALWVGFFRFHIPRAADFKPVEGVVFEVEDHPRRTRWGRTGDFDIWLQGQDLRYRLLSAAYDGFNKRGFIDHLTQGKQQKVPMKVELLVRADRSDSAYVEVAGVTADGRNYCDLEATVRAAKANRWACLLLAVGFTWGMVWCLYRSRR